MNKRPNDGKEAGGSKIVKKGPVEAVVSSLSEDDTSDSSREFNYTSSEDGSGSSYNFFSDSEDITSCGGSSSSENEWDSDDECDVTTDVTSDDFVWEAVQPPEDRADIRSKFTVDSTGPCNIPTSKNPVDFLKLFLTEELLLMMVENTNTCAKCAPLQEGEQAQSQRKWQDVTLNEMKKFWSILINMGLSQRFSDRYFWNEHPVLSYPFYNNVMDFKRFKSILTMFSLTGVPPENKTRPDPTVEVNSLLTFFNSAFKKYYVPDQDVRLDECLVMSSKQDYFSIDYRPKKYLTHGGVQKFEISDPSSEYIFHVGLRKFRPGKNGKTTLSTNNVFDLLNESGLTDKGYHLFMRKTYLDFKLSQQLLSKNIYVTGPLDKRNYKDFSSDIIHSDVRPGSTLYSRCGDHLLVKYNIQKPVCLTTGGRAEDQTTENAKCQQRVKPVVIRRYLKYWSIREKTNLHLTCTVAIKCRWKKIAFNLVDIALYNSFILFKSQNVKFSRQRFLEDIVEHLSLLRSESVPVKVPKVGRGHRLIKVYINRIETCEVCCKTEKEVSHVCPICKVFVHEQCFMYLNHDARGKRSLTKVPKPRCKPDPEPPSCLKVENCAFTEVNVKSEYVESDIDVIRDDPDAVVESNIEVKEEPEDSESDIEVTEESEDSESN